MMVNGITERKSDKVQPFRVYFQNKIVWFARTREEAEIVLKGNKYQEVK